MGCSTTSSAITAPSQKTSRNDERLSAARRAHPRTAGRVDSLWRAGRCRRQRQPGGRIGNPDHVANLRSSAKPFQALSLVESGGADAFGFSERELAIVCASHSGTDDHVAVLRGLQARLGVDETNLSCGVHWPMFEPTTQAMRARGEKPTSNRHNCSGKHTGMMAHALTRLLHGRLHQPAASHPAVHPGGLCRDGQPATRRSDPDGMDGCSAPNFAVPLFNAAYAMRCWPIRLACPSRAAALQRIFQAMTANPDMVAGPERFDTLIMGMMGGKSWPRAVPKVTRSSASCRVCSGLVRRRLASPSKSPMGTALTAPSAGGPGCSAPIGCAGRG